MFCNVQIFDHGKIVVAAVPPCHPLDPPLVCLGVNSATQSAPLMGLWPETKAPAGIRLLPRDLKNLRLGL